MNDVGNRWKTARKQFEMTQEEFAERLGVSRQYISLIEKGQRKPSKPLSMLMQKNFNVDREWLARGNVKQETNPFDTSEVKRCPCCGGSVGIQLQIRNRMPVYFVFCTRCGMRTAAQLTAESAKEIWNRRKEEYA